MPSSVPALRLHPPVPDLAVLTEHPELKTWIPNQVRAVASSRLADAC